MANSKKKLITSPFKGQIAALGGISGPIVNPQPVAIPVIRRMIGEGVVVFEVNPFDKEKKVKLTLSNVGKENFTAPANTVVKSVAKKPTAPQAKKEETPITGSDFQKK